LTALFVPVALLAWLAWLRTEYSAAERTRAAARASYQRRLASVQLLSSLREAESAQRGYVLTGDLLYLAPYGPAKQATLATIDLLTQDGGDLERAAMLHQLGTTALAKFTEMDRTIAVRNSGRFTTALSIVADDRGRRMMVLATTRANKVLDREQRALDLQIARYNESIRATRLIQLMVITLVTLGWCVALLILWRVRLARHEAQIAAFEAGERSQSILASTHDALLILNPSGTIEQSNPAASAMLGYNVEELARRDVDTVVPITTGSGSFFKRLGVHNGQLCQPLLPERQARHRDGRIIPVDVALSLMEVPSGTHVIASLRDVSERKRMDRVKDELISTVSHELRTPLTSVVGALGLLRARAVGSLPTDAVRLIEISDNNARRLIRLINDMLDLDRVGAGSFDVQRNAVDVRDAVTRACEGSEGLGAMRQVRIACSVPKTPVVVSGDSDRLVQVLTNLLSNAVRVSPEGGRIGVSMRFDGGREVLLTVDDDGPGIPRGFRDRIFGRFERAENNVGPVGAGLGLAVSRMIVEAHNGRIWFEDRPGGGTRFAVALPIRRPPEPLGIDGTTRLLICAGEAATQERLAELFAADHYRTDCVPTVAAAREALGRGRYDALLLELSLPDESGLLLAHDLRRADGTSQLPIIIVSDGEQDDAAAQGALDVVDWITKPIDPSRLSTAVLAAVSRSGSKRPVVLHLDDDEDILEVTAAMLQPDTIVLKASTLAEAHALLETSMPDVAILDLKLAEGSGLDILPMLIDADGLAVPAIIFSAQDVTPVTARQVSAVLVKSRRSLPDLRATLRRVLHAAPEQRNR
jgi:PAS domain S-box-containing protein